MKDKITLLVVEDNSDHFDLFLSNLELTDYDNSIVIHKETLKDGFETLLTTPVDISFIDLSLPDSSISETLEKIPALSKHAPVVVITSLNDKQTILDVIEKGADDCIPKMEMNDLLLERTIRFNIDRWNLKQELVKQQSINKSIIETIPDLLWLKDINGIYITCNPRFEEFFGASLSEIVGKTDYDFVDKELADFFRMHDKKALYAGKPTSNQEIITFATTGKEALLETTKTPVVGENGDLIGVLGIGHDITENQTLLNKVTEGQKLLEDLLDAIPLNIYQIDLNGKLTFVNETIAKSLKMKKSNILGKTAYDFYPEELAKKYTTDDALVIKSKRVFETVEEHQDPNSESTYVKVIKIPIFDVKQNVIGIQGIFWDITSEYNQKKLLEHSAKYDSLTGLPNRFLFNEILETSMNKIDKRNMAVLYIDLDGFKAVNDTFGHEAGDMVLKVVSKRMSEIIREEDSVARLGGDEFVIYISGIKDKNSICKILNRLLKDINQPIPYEVEGEEHSLKVSASIGITLFPLNSAIDSKELLRQADQAMYDAKNSGKNQYRFFSEI
jgi:diguanylate cyclase (GGDEF)-like protein/PAS domain S-box-containing protein